MGDFDGFRALSFDCYGTLIDWETGIVAALGTWITEAAVDLDPAELLAAFADIASAVERQRPAAPYPEVLGEVLREIGRRHGVTVTRGAADAFGASVGDWPAFEDSPAALTSLGERFKLIILSNVDRRSFRRSNDRLGVEFDLILTAQDIGSYKPSPRNFEALLRKVGELGMEPGALLHVAQSLFHDHVPAKAAGLATAWIDRRGSTPGFGATPPPAMDVEPDWRFPSMEAFAAAAVGGDGPTDGGTVK